MTLPRPAPISSVNDLLIPAAAVLVACVLSIIWARAASPSSKVHPATTKILCRDSMPINSPRQPEPLSHFPVMTREARRLLRRSERQGKPRHQKTKKCLACESVLAVLGREGSLPEPLLQVLPRPQILDSQFAMRGKRSSGVCSQIGCLIRLTQVEVAVSQRNL